MAPFATRRPHLAVVRGAAARTAPAPAPADADPAALHAEAPLHLREVRRRGLMRSARLRRVLAHQAAAVLLTAAAATAARHTVGHLVVAFGLVCIALLLIGRRGGG